MNILVQIDNLSGNRLRILWAYIIKDLKDVFRFRFSILNFIFSPMLTMVSFFMVYASVFLIGNVDDLGYVSESNYVIYLLTGFMAYSCFNLTWGKTDLHIEKLMLTLEGVLVSPRSRLYIMVGKGIRGFIEILIIVSLFIPIVWLLHPAIDWPALAVGSLALLLMFIIFISFDFIISAIGLAQEGISGFFTNYIPRAFLIVGAVYFPKQIIPEYFQWLVDINPVYHGVNLFRAAFMTADLPYGTWISLLYLIILAIITPIIAAWTFDYVLKRWGIRGY
ncbi:MAG: ABC transporter permease [Candidatus Kerfeldbacteria bacterium]